MINTISYYTIDVHFKRSPIIQLSIIQKKSLNELMNVSIYFSEKKYIDEFKMDIELTKDKLPKNMINYFTSNIKDYKFFKDINPIYTKNSFLTYFIQEKVGVIDFIKLLTEVELLYSKNEKTFALLEKISNKVNCVDCYYQHRCFSNDYMLAYNLLEACTQSVNFTINKYCSTELNISNPHRAFTIVNDVCEGLKEKERLFIQDLGIFEAYIDITNKKSIYYGVIDDEKDFELSEPICIFEIDTILLSEILNLTSKISP